MEKKRWGKVKKSVKNLFMLSAEVLIEVWLAVSYTIEKNMYALAKMLEFSTPYLMWFLTIQLHEERGKFLLGGELFVPVIIFFVCGVVKRISNKNGQGYEIPVAKKRFTTEGEFGEVSISESDLQEVILYLNDVENYIEKRGMQKWES